MPQAVIATIRGLSAGAVMTAAALVSAGATADEQTFGQNCGGCHEVGRGARHGVGPALTNVYGRRAGGVTGFRYSEQLAEAGGDGLVWNEETLDGFLEDPRGYLWGNRMAYSGLADVGKRRAIIGFLRDAARGRQDAIGEQDGGR